MSGSWKIMVILEPRMRFSLWTGRPSNSWPLNLIDPEALPFRARSPMAAMKVWLLPEPLSPTTPRHSPLATASEMPRTASTSPSWVEKPILRSSIDRTGSDKGELPLDCASGRGRDVCAYGGAPAC